MPLDLFIVFVRLVTCSKTSFIPGSFFCIRHADTNGYLVKIGFYRVPFLFQSSCLPVLFSGSSVRTLIRDGMLLGSASRNRGKGVARQDDSRKRALVFAYIRSFQRAIYESERASRSPFFIRNFCPGRRPRKVGSYRFFNSIISHRQLGENDELRSDSTESIVTSGRMASRGSSLT